MPQPPLTWNEIRTRAAAFVHEWRDEAREHAEAKTFWDDLLRVFGVERRRVASFEEAVKKADRGQGFIDLFWPGVMIAEHKSRGKSLDRARAQAFDYFPGLADARLPRYVVVSDFARIRVSDLDAGTETEFALTDLLDNLQALAFVAGYEKRPTAEQDPVNVAAAARMGALHDALADAGYTGHALEVMLVRLLFCLFADDTGLFAPRGAFQDLIETRTRGDGADLGPLLGALFDTLDTPPDRCQTTLDDALAAFPYVNGRSLPRRSVQPRSRPTCARACSARVRSTGAASRRPSSGRSSSPRSTRPRGANSARTTRPRPTSSNSSGRSSSTG